MHSAVSSGSATSGNTSVTVQALKEFAGLHHELTEVQWPPLLPRCQHSPLFNSSWSITVVIHLQRALPPEPESECHAATVHVVDGTVYIQIFLVDGCCPVRGEYWHQCIAT